MCPAGTSSLVLGTTGGSAENGVVANNTVRSVAQEMTFSQKKLASVEKVGGAIHTEYWIPAEDLAAVAVSAYQNEHCPAYFERDRPLRRDYFRNSIVDP
jgi:hypothetical protein